MNKIVERWKGGNVVVELEHNTEHNVYLARTYVDGKRERSIQFAKITTFTPRALDAHFTEYKESIEWSHNITLMKVIDKQQQAMLALEHLTPGGSEFVGDVDRCVAYVQESRATMFKVLKTNKLLADRYRAALSVIGNVAGGPTMQYADGEVQLTELQNRMSEVSRLVLEALTQ